MIDLRDLRFRCYPAQDCKYLSRQHHTFLPRRPAFQWSTVIIIVAVEPSVLLRLNPCLFPYDCFQRIRTQVQMPHNFVQRDLNPVIIRNLDALRAEPIQLLPARCDGSPIVLFPQQDCKTLWQVNTAAFSGLP